MIILADPSIGSLNIGDRIIQHYVRNELPDFCPDQDIVQTVTQLRTISKRMHVAIDAAEKVFVGGTNLLSHRIPLARQWANFYQYLPFGRKIHLLGVGWSRYEHRAVPGNRLILERLLASNLHAVRDEYSRTVLQKTGIESINTSCISLWSSPPQIERCKKISRIIFTLTDYNRNIPRDLEFLTSICTNIAAPHNADIIFWPQAPGDVDYFRHVRNAGNFQKYDISAAESCLASLERLTGAESIYIGTRLHAGIHCLNRQVPAYIFAIDNRAAEIARDVDLPAFFNQGELSQQIDRDIELKLPHNQIALFKNKIRQSMTRQ